MVLRRLLADKRRGFYVDVGAHHPKLYSNTYYFYLRDWRGINIDAMPGSMRAFRRHRPRDVNVEAAISDRVQSLTYYTFNEPALNGFHAQLSLQRSQDNPDWHITSKLELHTRTLKDVLDQHVPAGQTIDFLSIDVEGLDYEVLNSNDWTRYRPTVVLAEDSQASTYEEVLSSRAYAFMAGEGYTLHAKTVNTMFFLDSSVPRPPIAGAMRA